MNFTKLLSRADEETLEHLIGRDSLRLLHTLDEQLTLPSRLRKVVLDLRGAQHLLTDTESCRLLFDLLTKQEARQLASLLDANSTRNAYQALKEARIYKNSSREELLSG